jgi:hypothetical protein
MDLSMDGKLVASITGEITVFEIGRFGNVSSGANEYTRMYFQIVDFIGVFGTADYDNAQISTAGSPLVIR